MGRKSRLKRRKYDLTKSEFITYVCTQCRLCAPNTDPKFCYDGCYNDDPKVFIKKVLKNLKEIKSALNSVAMKDFEMQNDDEFEFILEEAICASNICGNGDLGSSGCGYKLGCLHALRDQMLSRGGRVISIGPHRGRKNKKGKKNNRVKLKKQKYVPPTPKFFCNEGFRPEVDRIVNGTNAEQQDKGKEPTGCATTDAGGGAESSKP